MKVKYTRDINLPYSQRCLLKKNHVYNSLCAMCTLSHYKDYLHCYRNKKKQTMIVKKGKCRIPVGHQVAGQRRAGKLGLQMVYQLTK